MEASIEYGFKTFAVATCFVGLAMTSPPSGVAQVGTTATPRLVLTETRAAIDLSATLPGFQDFLSSASTDLQGERTDWEASWEVGASRGREMRSAVYEALVQKRLAESEEGLDRVLDLLRTEVETIGAFQDDLPLHLSLSFREASGLLSQAESAAESSRWPEVALSALKTADALRELTPKAVALALIETAEGVLAAEPGPQDVSEEDLTRAGRLVLWARSAVRGGNHMIAVERAYYACRLAGVILP